MSAWFEFSLSDEDTDRLFAVKNIQGRNELSSNDFARELLEKELYRLHPRRVKFNEKGEEI